MISVFLLVRFQIPTVMSDFFFFMNLFLGFTPGQNNKQMFVSKVIGQWLARRLATGEVLGSNSGKGEND